MDVVCSDIYDTELRASALHNRYDVAPRIRYLDIDATNIPFENYFDFIAFKSILAQSATATAVNNNKKPSTRSSRH